MTHAALQAPHQQATPAAAAAGPAPVLFVQDTTSLNYSRHPATGGLGPIGSSTQRGLHVHTLLALAPAPDSAGATPTPALLGLAQQAVWVRAGKGKGRAPASEEAAC